MCNGEMRGAGDMPVERFEAAGLPLQRTMRPRVHARLRQRRQDLLQRVQPATGGLPLEIAAEEDLHWQMRFRYSIYNKKSEIIFQIFN